VINEEKSCLQILKVSNKKMNKNTNKQIFFNPKLIISDHFNEVINKLNGHVKDLVFKTDSIELSLINKTKNTYIHHLKMIENYNLDQMKANTICLEQSNEKKTLDFIKRVLIKVDCFLLRNTRSKLGYSLIITDWFVNSENVAFLR
jgi:hypothetical protein